MRWILIFLVILNGIEFFWLSHKADVREESGQQALTAPSTQGVKRLMLFSEANQAKDKRSGGVSAASNKPNVAVPSSTSGNIDRGAKAKPICGLLGPFPEIITARQFVHRLESLEIQAKLKRQSMLADPVFLVYLEPRKSRKEALGLLKELQTKRLDSFLITEGELKHGISLGFFRLAASAEKVRQARIKEGYDAKIVKKERQREILWSALEPEEYVKLTSRLFQQLRNDYDYLQKRQNFCSHIASLDDIE